MMIKIATSVPPIPSERFPRNRIASARPFAKPDSRIDEAIDHVGCHVHDDVGKRECQYASFYQRIVTRADRGNHQPPETGPRENHFGDDRAREQSAELQAEECYDRR